MEPVARTLSGLTEELSQHVCERPALIDGEVTLTWVDAVPHRIVSVSDADLPRTTTGKVVKRELSLLLGGSTRSLTVRGRLLGTRWTA